MDKSDNVKYNVCVSRIDIYNLGYVFHDYAVYFSVQSLCFGQ